LAKKRLTLFDYIPSYLSMTLFFAHFNYYTHRPRGKDSVEILNLNYNPFYKFLNFLSFGAYFHKNHHRKPSLFNPAGIGEDSIPLISYSS